MPKLSEAAKLRKITSIYRRWLEDEKFFDKIAVKPELEYSDVNEVLRNLGSAIAYAQSIVNKRRALAEKE